MSWCVVRWGPTRYQTYRGHSFDSAIGQLLLTGYGPCLVPFQLQNLCVYHILEFSKRSWVICPIFNHDVVVGGYQFVGSAPTGQVIATQKLAIEHKGNDMTKAIFAAKQYVYGGLTVRVV